MVIEQLYDIYLEHPKVTTDSRKIEKDTLFFALRGENFNGNTFAAEAIEKGARYAVVDQKDLPQNPGFIFVEDVLEILQNLAVLHRLSFDIPFIALTGSNGKTTTKELLQAVLSQKYKTHATKGNLNNHIGVPLTLLEIPRDAEIAIIEMGANHLDEIHFLCQIAHPTHGLITNVGKAHLEGFGSFEGVQKGKSELYAYLAEYEGNIFVQGDNPYLVKMLENRKAFSNVIVSYGTHLNNDIVGEADKATPYLEVIWKNTDTRIKTHLTGLYNLDNVLAAISVGNFFKISTRKIKDGIEGYFPNNQRSQIIQTERNTIIADYYNANPSSMQAALDNLKSMQAKNKVIILGDMFELGGSSSEEHQQIIEKAKLLHANRVVLVGKNFKGKATSGAEFYETIEEAKTALIESPITNSTVLMKGSRGIALENLIEIL